ncbi:MAG: M56 family metallopeptidase, partial [Rubripirellula sp.]
MIDLFFSVVAPIAALMLYAAWRTLPLLVVVLLVDLLFRKRIAARFHCLLWAMVLARLLMPVSISSPLSLHRQVDDFAETLFTTDAEPAALQPIKFDTFTFQANDDGQEKVFTIPVIPPDSTDEYRAAAQAYVANLDAESFKDTNARYNQIDAESSSPTPTWDLIVAGALLATWLLVTLWLLTRSLISHMRFARQLRGCETITHWRIENSVTAACQRLKLRRKPVAKEVPELAVPAVFGLWRPVVCLPVGTSKELSREEIDWVMMHELAHIRRCDALLLTLAIIVRSLHWFNPFAHVALWRLRHYMEQAADDLATRRMPEQSVLDYGRLLIRYASQTPTASTKHAAIGLLFMASSKRLRGRIEMLDRNSARNHWLAKTVAALMILIVGLVGMTDAQPIDYQPIPPDYEFDWSTDWLDEPVDPIRAEAAEKANFIIPQEPQEPQTEVTYDVSTVLEKLAAAEPDFDAEENLKSYFVGFPGAPQASFVALKNNKLTLRQSEAAHLSTRRLLRSFARSGPWQISIESRVIVADPKVASAIDWQHRSILPSRTQTPSFGSAKDAASLFPPNIPEHFQQPFDPKNVDTVFQGTHEVAGDLPMIAVKVSKQQAQYFVQRAQRELQTNMMLAPKVTLFNGQYAVLSDQTQRPFVTGLRAPAEGATMQPIIDIVKDGWQIELLAEVTE